MQDAIIKGIGNSRYLKTVGEALSLYPTYEDFLQAMIEGTFPVDFNGINKDGWTQQGTPLNKANLLSDTVISTLGLSTGVNSTPNDAFNVLANIGNVHVWRKTVTTEEGIPEVPEVPPSYELGEAQTQYFIRDKDRGKAITMLYSNSVSVSYDGRVSLVSPSSVVITTTNTTYPFTYVSGKFIQAQGGGTGVEPETTSIFYMKPSGVLQNSGESSSWDVYGTECQMVNGIAAVPGTPAVPPGTHITYLTSTNRNAYQEGADGSEKPAGYKLGSKITGNIALTDRTNESSTIYWNYSDQVDVSDDGKVSLIAPNRVDFNATQSNAVNMAESLVGNFIMTTSSATAIKANTVYFIPDDASVAREMSGTKFVYTTAIQSVTGYPAIPAGTTIEYLGVLGDKTSIETGSYVGTGTYGSGNPNTLTFGFEPKFVHIQSYSIGNADGTGYGFAFFLSGTRGFTIGPSSSNDLYLLNAKFNKNILSWYQNNEYAQLNEKKVKYFFAALG